LLRGFAEFLRSPKIIAGLVTHKGESSLAAAVGEANNAVEVDLLLTGNNSARAELAKVLEVVAGGKTPKIVKIGEFQPNADVILEKSEIGSVVDDFRRYLESEWEDGRYCVWPSEQSEFLVMPWGFASGRHKPVGRPNASLFPRWIMRQNRLMRN
jgi:hypothetical protein